MSEASRRWYAKHKDDPKIRERLRADSKRHYEKNSEAIITRQLAYAKTPEGARKIRNLSLKRKYGITIEQYEAIAKRQDGECATCHKTPEKLVVDHDHTNGRVRGLLCDKCNRGLGLAYDNPDSIRRALAYLERVP